MNTVSKWHLIITSRLKDPARPDLVNLIPFAPFEHKQKGGTIRHPNHQSFQRLNGGEMRQEVLLTNILSYKVEVHHLTEDNLKDEEKEIKTGHHHRFFSTSVRYKLGALLVKCWLLVTLSYVNEKHVRVCVLRKPNTCVSGSGSFGATAKWVKQWPSTKLRGKRHEQPHTYINPR